MSELPRVRRHANGTIAVSFNPNPEHWRLFENGSFTGSTFGELTGDGWTELFVAELPGPDGWTNQLCGHIDDVMIRRLILNALTDFVEEHGEVSDDPDDVTSAASAIWDALGINTTSDDAAEVTP